VVSSPQPDRRKIVFLFSDTGGGHRSASEALIEAIDLVFPGQISCEMIDMFKEYAPPPFHLAPRIYPPLSRHTTLWGMGYRISDGPRRTRALFGMLWPYIRRNLRQLLDEHPCDLVVSVHQLFNLPVARMVASRGLPFVTVVTDLVTTHAAWYATRATRIVVPTDEAFRRGLKVGVRPEQMRVVGLPVAERFRAQLEDRAAIRRRLDWRDDRPVVLMMGGGEGMGPIEEMALAIETAGLPVELAIITGRNATLKTRLNAHRWHLPVHVYGFVSEMPAFMRAADILVTKAGPGTISEAFIAGLPMILYSKMPGQEDGNVSFVVNTGAGVWAPQPRGMVAMVRYWLEHPEERDRAARVCSSLARPDAAREIARILAVHAGIGQETTP
jgi:1,2-diacylglycerol 3-beta-galactosyltransferase